MKLGPKLVLGGGLLLVAAGVMASSPPTKSSKPHFVVVATDSSGDRVFIADEGHRTGYLYVGFPIGQRAEGPRQDAGANSQCPPGTVSLDGQCVKQLGSPLKYIVCQPAVCNPPGPVPRGDPRPEELFMGLRVFINSKGIQVEPEAR